MERRNSRNARLFAGYNMPARSEQNVAVMEREDKTRVFINATGRPLCSFGNGTYEAAIEKYASVITWRSLETDIADFSTDDVYEYAIETGREILSRFPGAAVLCQGDWGFAIALASYISKNGGKALYARKITDAVLSTEFEGFSEYKFPNINPNHKFREYDPDQVLLNFTAHTKRKWFDRRMYLDYGASRTVDVITGNLSYERIDLDKARRDFEAWGRYMGSSANASEAVVTGEWGCIAALVPVLIEAGIHPLYPVMSYAAGDHNVYDRNGRLLRSFYCYREYRIYEGK